MKTKPTYLTGEPIEEGDSIRIGHLEGVVEEIITSSTKGWADYWQEFGEGVMLTSPAFGRIYTKYRDEDLVFVGRRLK